MSGAPAADLQDREIELCLMVDPADWERLSSLPLIARCLAAPLKIVTTVYYDTPGFGLKAQGFALRVRESGGTFVQTIKGAETDKKGVKDRFERNFPVSSLQPDVDCIDDDDFKAKIVEETALAPLNPQFTTLIARNALSMEAPCGSILECVIDRGSIISGEQRMPVNEIELELVSGHPAALLEIAAQIVHYAPLRVGVWSKADRGYALVTGEIATPVKAGKTKLAKAATVDDALAECLGGCLVQTVANEPAVMDARAPSGVHQMRVSLRRLRAALGVFRKAVGRDVTGPLNAEARELAQALGQVRDFDVMRVDILDPVIADSATPDAFAPLVEALEAERHARWEALIAELSESGAVAAFTMQLGRDIERRYWRTALNGAALDAPAVEFARDRLRKRAKSVAAHGKGIEALSIEARHELRIEIKKLRYAVEFFSSLFDARAAGAYARKLARLQDMFGALNDVSNAVALLPPLVDCQPEADRPALGKAVKHVIDWHAARADKDWVKACKRFGEWRKTDPFWKK